MQAMAVEAELQLHQKYCWGFYSMDMQRACSAHARSSGLPYESIPFRFLSGHLHPEHDTIASFRQRFLGQIKGLFVQVLLLAIEAGVLALDDVSLDGTKIHADASKSKAISYGHLVKRRAALEVEVDELLKLSEAADAPSMPEDFNVRAEIERRQQKLATLAQAATVLQARAEERHRLEQAE